MNAAYKYMKFLVTFQRHDDGLDENTSPLTGLRAATLPEDNLFIERHCRVYYPDRYDKPNVAPLINYY